MISFKDYLNEDLDEAIKGWKHAHSDIAKMRAAAASAGNDVKLVRLKKDGKESGMHDATKTFKSEEEARAHHENMVKLNPGRGIAHNLYVGGEHKEVLKEEVELDEGLKSKVAAATLAACLTASGCKVGNTDMGEPTLGSISGKPHITQTVKKQVTKPSTSMREDTELDEETKKEAHLKKMREKAEQQRLRDIATARARGDLRTPSKSGTGKIGMNQPKGVSIDIATGKVQSPAELSVGRPSYRFEHVELDEANFADTMKKAIAAHERGDHARAKYHLDNAKTARYAMKSTEISKHKDLLDKYKELRDMHEEFELSESYVGRETKDGVWRVFKTGNPVAVAGPFKSSADASAWIRSHSVSEEVEQIEEVSTSLAGKILATRQKKLEKMRDEKGSIAATKTPEYKKELSKAQKTGAIISKRRTAEIHKKVASMSKDDWDKLNKGYEKDAEETRKKGQSND